MFANNEMSGTDVAFPDVCLTPGSGPPVPIPYLNTAKSSAAVSFVAHVLITSAPAHNLQTNIPMTSGDEPGVAGGVSSGTVTGKAHHTTGANTVIVGSAPLTRLTSMTQQNSTNAIGVRIVPSQVKVLVLSP